jgi:LemA protein
MKYLLIPLGAILVLGFIVVSWFLGVYNGLVTQNTTVDTAWASVQTQYQRRFDLIPNLVNATKGAMKQEQAVFGAIADARTRYAGAPSGSNAQVQAAGQYESAIARLLVVMENYPQLKSIDTVKGLTDELAGTENRVLISRDRYNEQVRIFNTQIKRFPTNMLAGMFGFNAREFFAAEQCSEKAPMVNL